MPFTKSRHLPEDERAELSDYPRCGFDRGHMAPNGDMPDAEFRKVLLARQHDPAKSLQQ